MSLENVNVWDEIDYNLRSDGILGLAIKIALVADSWILTSPYSIIWLFLISKLIVYKAVKWDGKSFEFYILGIII